MLDNDQFKSFILGGGQPVPGDGGDHGGDQLQDEGAHQEAAQGGSGAKERGGGDLFIIVVHFVIVVFSVIVVVVLFFIVVFDHVCHFGLINHGQWPPFHHCVICYHQSSAVLSPLM